MGMNITEVGSMILITRMKNQKKFYSHQRARKDCNQRGGMGNRA
jgi:hypothetical protein